MFWSRLEYGPVRAELLQDTPIALGKGGVLRTQSFHAVETGSKGLVEIEATGIVAVPDSMGVM